MAVAETEIIVRIFAAAACGALLGFEREKIRKPAGIRTHALVTMGSALFTIMSIFGFAGSDPSRIAAGIVTGIGFLGAGAIFKSKTGIAGLTTAASLWIASAIGVALGAGFYMIGLVVTAIAFVVLLSKKYEDDIVKEFFSKRR